MKPKQQRNQYVLKKKCKIRTTYAASAEDGILQKSLDLWNVSIIASSETETFHSRGQFRPYICFHSQCMRNFELLRSNLFCTVKMIVWSNIILVWTIISLRLTATTRNKEKVWSKFKIASGAEYFVTKAVYSFAQRLQ